MWSAIGKEGESERIVWDGYRDLESLADLGDELLNLVERHKNKGFGTQTKRSMKVVARLC